MQNEITIDQAIRSFLDTISHSRGENTSRTYRNALNAFYLMLEEHDFSSNDKLLYELPEDAIAWFASYLKDYSPATERLYLTAAMGFYEYLVAEYRLDLNLPRVRMLIRQRGRRLGQRLPQFPKEHIAIILEYAIKIAINSSGNEIETLRNLRDRAFLFTLADTGLRVHECLSITAW